jgi:hypothetical protein
MNEPPPLNRAQAWYRVLLWLAPTGFAYAISKLGIIGRPVMRAIPLSSRFWYWFAIAVVIAFCAYCGWLDGNLSSEARRAEGEERKIQVQNHAITFCLRQVVIIPVLLGIAVFGACMMGIR